MTAIFLFATLCVILVWNGWQTFQDRKERRHLIAVIVGRTPSEVRVLNGEVPAPPARPTALTDEEQFWLESEEHHPIGL